MNHMEKGDGFWTGPSISNPKGWKTRREQQDAYRRALDEQIEQRKVMDQLRNKKRTEPTTAAPQVNDPIRHLMPWLADSNNDSQKRFQNTDSPPPPPQGYTQSPPTQVLPIQQPFYGLPQQQTPQMPNYYYMTPQQGTSQQQSAYQGIPPPQQFDNRIQPCPEGIPPPQQFDNRNQANSQHNIPPYSHSQQPQTNNIPFNIYGSTPIPPPPAFMQASYPPVVYPPYNHNQAAQPAQTMQTENMRNEHQSNTQSISIHEEKQATGNENATKKPHVSQTSDSSPDMSKLKGSYANDLKKQMDERRKHEEELKAQEKLEEERLQKKVQEDHQRMQREYAEEERRKKAKEEEKNQQQAEVVRRTKEVQAEEATRRRLQKEEERRKKIEENKNSTALKTPTYKPLPYNPFDSTPLPTIGKPDQQDQTEIKISANQTPKESSHVLAKEQPSPYDHKSAGDNQSVNPNLVDNKQNATHPNNNNNTSKKSYQPIGDNKNIENFQHDSKETVTDDIICPKCCKSFSATDIQVTNSEGHQKALRFLQNFKTILQAEQQNISAWSEDSNSD